MSAEASEFEKECFFVFICSESLVFVLRWCLYLIVIYMWSMRNKIIGDLLAAVILPMKHNYITAFQMFYFAAFSEMQTFRMRERVISLLLSNICLLNSVFYHFVLNKLTMLKENNPSYCYILLRCC